MGKTKAVAGELILSRTATALHELEAAAGSDWARQMLARLESSSDDEKAELAQEARRETLERADRWVQGAHSLFEVLDVIRQHELYRSFGHGNIRDFVRKEIAPHVSLHESTVKLLAGASEEKGRLEAEFGSCTAGWTLLSRLGPESRRQLKGKGKLGVDRWRELSRRVALGPIPTKSELLTELSGPTASTSDELMEKVVPGQLSGQVPSESMPAEPELSRDNFEPLPDDLTDPFEEQDDKRSDQGDVAWASRELDQMTQELSTLLQRAKRLQDARQVVAELSPEDLSQCLEVTESMTRELAKLVESLRSAKAGRDLEDLEEVTVIPGEHPFAKPIWEEADED